MVRKNTAEKINVMKKKPSPRIETEDKKNPVPPSEKQANDKTCRKDDNNDRENHIEKEVTGEKASMALPISASTESEETHTPDTEARGELHTQVIIPDGGPGAHELQKEVTVVHKQSARLRPPSVRPSSARPAAPRLRDKVDTVVPPEQLVPLGKVHVIVEHAVSDNEDNEETVRLEMPVEDVVQLAETSSIPVERGHLVQQILAQIGEPIDTPVSTAVPCVEDHRLVQSIQTVTRAANPLGKLVSYVHEDVDSMLGELRTWSAVNRRLREELQHERQRDHDASRPLLQQLQRLDADLVRHRHLIHTAQASVIRNQHKIKLLLTPTQ